jgi:VWFA-related protein
MSRRSVLLPLITLVIAAVSLVAWQQPQRPVQPPPQDVPTFSSVSDLVNILCAVRDKKGRLINTLEKPDFQILEDGKPQEIKYFTRENSLPLTIGLLIDSSPSQGNLIGIERQASMQFFSTVLREKDMAFLISFDSSVDLLTDLTNNKGQLQRGLDQVRVGGGGVSGGPFPNQGGGGTHLYDALYLAATDKLASEVGRKTVILVTDGEDQGSKLRVERAIEAAQKADVVVYGVHYVDEQFYHRGGFGMGGYSGQGVLKKMAEETGGRMISPNRNTNLNQAYQEIAEELRSQYSIGYQPTNAKRDGSFRKLEIKVNQQDLKVQARKGYYAVTPGEKP